MEDFTIDGNKLRYLETSKMIIDNTDKSFKAPDGFLIPLKKSVVIKRASNEDAATTEGGLIIPAAASQNTNIPNIGIIYAVGPEVDVLLQPGQKVAFNQYANLEIMIKGVIYMMVSEMDVYGVLPDKAYVRIDPKTDAEVSTGKRMERNVGYLDRKFKQDQEMLDIKESTKKKK